MPVFWIMTSNHLQADHARTWQFVRTHPLLYQFLCSIPAFLHRTIRFPTKHLPNHTLQASERHGVAQLECIHVIETPLQHDPGPNIWSSSLLLPAIDIGVGKAWAILLQQIFEHAHTFAYPVLTVEILDWDRSRAVKI